MVQFFSDWVKNIVGKGENARNQHVLFCQNVFYGQLIRIVKTQDCVEADYPFVLEMDKEADNVMSMSQKIFAGIYFTFERLFLHKHSPKIKNS